LVGSEGELPWALVILEKVIKEKLVRTRN
jgi:hypothetical protein